MTTAKKRRIPPGREPAPKRARNSTSDEAHLQGAIDAIAYIDLTNETKSINPQPPDWGTSFRVNPGIRSENQPPMTAAQQAAALPAGGYDTCFGLLCMQATSSRGERVPLECTPAALRFEGKVVRIVLDSTNDGVAVLVSETLSHLVKESAVTLTATVCGKNQKFDAPNGSAGFGMSYQAGTRLLSLRIIVYGFMQQKDAIADTLAEGNLFLQHPGESEFDRSVKYVNPQYLLGPGQELPPVEELSVCTCCAPHGPQSAQARGPLSESEVNQVQKIFDTAATSNGAIAVPKPSSRLVTELKRHQVEALAMMIEKEEGTHEQAHFPSIWKACRGPGNRVTYQNIVTELFEFSPPDPLGGGILADEMGLGKTLSSLSLICHYLDLMDQTAHLNQDTPRTTLIVTPKSTIYGWQKQINGCELSSQGGPSKPVRLQLSPSAKLEAVLHNISQSQEQAVPNSKSRKAYVTEILLGNALEERGWAFQRIDGQLSLAQRKDALEEFGNDSQCNIMLASIGAAGEGIDLTSATSVHIVEPHWNPMAESQAIDRVHRIGQKQDVKVVRYVVKDSIEEYVRWVQYHKLQLIKESLSASEKRIDVLEVRWKKLLEFLE
ncbi:hypothetical protein ETB97_007262 [Aspergillus alliaceus]|uniref:Helicase C-terminal domain-containing protein n=1 Tax=Petromyces alliaceus TaxID=209559 RepID=A0A8H5ZVK0_PETAA|nr:hypothetical protein ETB97_007262 [Aspergillus burnettii]